MSRAAPRYHVLVKRPNGWRWYGGRGYATGLGYSDRRFVAHWNKSCEYSGPWDALDDPAMKGLRITIVSRSNARRMQARMNRGEAPF